MLKRAINIAREKNYKVDAALSVGTGEHTDRDHERSTRSRGPVSDLPWVQPRIL